MKIVIAPDSFKGCLSSIQVADNIEIGIKRVFCCAEVVKIPIADGGEGTVESLINCTNGNIVKVKVKDPLMRDIDAFYGILGDGITAVIEMAAASGICTLNVEERDPLKTTTYGVGELIIDAINKGCKKIIIGLGGSATNDGGAGMLQALGVRLLDKNGDNIQYGGGNLHFLQSIDISQMDKRIKECKIIAACDVVNPLCGSNGASFVFGPQKGATPAMVSILDKNLEHYAKIIKKELNISIKDLQGAGAAGGLGGGVLAFLK